VVFTFDGDSAGQKAAMRAFQDDQKFVTQTFVAVEPSGMDPCELRQHKGDTAVRDLVARRVPLFEFALRTTIGRFDLDTVEGRTQATRAGMDVVRQIRDVSLRSNYARSLAGWIGLADPDELVRASRGGVDEIGRRVAAEPSVTSGLDPHDPALRVERDSLKIVLQTPALAGAAYDDLDDAVYTAPAYAAVRAAVRAAGGVAEAGAGGATWVEKVDLAAADDGVRGLVRGLAVESLPASDQGLTRYATEVLARLEELAATRRITEVKSRLQRLNPVEQVAEYNRLFGELVALEAHRRSLRERAIGTL
jgi:DNA primase